MIPVNILVQPYDLAASVRVDVRAGDAGSAHAYGLGGNPWRPAVTTRPTLSIELMSPTLDGRVQAGKCTFELSLSALGLAGANNLKWRGAPVTVYIPTALALGTAEFVGVVTDDAQDLNAGTIRLSCEVSTEFLDRPLLTAEFTGGGGILGDADKRGTLKPAGFGAVPNIEPVWFDLTRWIGMIDGYANLTSVSRLLEGLNDLGATVGNYASYAALAAAIDSDAIPPGRWGTCIVEGLIGLGAPPVKPVTVDAVFGFNRVGTISQRILTTHAGISAGLVDATAFNAVDTALPYNVHYWTAGQRQVKDMLEALAASINATPLVSFQGKVTITRAIVSASVGTLDRSGKQLPRVTDWKSAGTIKPVWRIKARTARPARVLDFSDINYADDIIDRGLYVATTVYRQGNLVWLSDKSSWLYVNAVPAAGNAPPTWPTTSNLYWQNLTPPTTTAGVLTAIGSHEVISGNSIQKVGGTANTEQGGVVGAPSTGSLFVRSRLLSNGVALPGTGSETRLALDNDATSFGYASMSFFAQMYDNGAWTLYADNVLVASGTTSIAVTSFTQLAYEGTKVSLSVDGVSIGSVAATENLRLWPKVLEYNASGALGLAIREIVYGPWSQNNWSAGGGTGRPADYATADLVPVSIGSQAVTIRGNTFIRNAGTGDYNACVRSIQYIDAMFAEVDIQTVGSAFTIISFDDTVNDTAQASMNYLCSYQYSTGAWAIYTTGTLVASGTIASVGGKLVVTHDGIRFRFYITAAKTGPDVLTTAGLTLFAKWHDYSGTDYMRGLRAGAYSANYWSDVSGPGRPETYATSGQNLVPNSGAEDAVVFPWSTVNVTSTSALSVTTAQFTTGARSFLLNKPTTGDTITMASAARPVLPGKTYVVRCRVKAGVASASGCSFRVWAKATELPNINTNNGENYAGTNYSLGYENIATSTSWTLLEALWTCPAGLYWASANIENGAVGPLNLYVDEVFKAEQVDFSVGIGGPTKPENNADITSTVKGPGLATINCNSVGTVLAGELDKTYGFLLIRADGTDATASAAWSRTVEAGTITSTIGAATGVFSISAFGSDGARIKISAVLSGKTYNAIFEPSKARAAAASGGSGGGNSGSSNINAAVTSTTPAAITVADLYVKAGTGGIIDLTVSGAFSHAPNTTSSLGLKLKIQKWNGSAFADLSAEQSETAASFYYSGDLSWEDGSFGFVYSDTGLTSGTEYRYRVVGYTPSGTVTRNTSGSLSGVGS